MSKKRKTMEQFKKEVYDLVGDKYEVLGEYKNAMTKILMKHNKCGHEYMVTPNRFLSGCRCPYCAGRKKKTTEQFKKEVYDLVGNEYTILGEYKNLSTKILMKHNKCGHKYLVNPYNFLLGYNKCPVCHVPIRKNLNTDIFKEEVKKLVGDEYTVLGEYINANTKILIKHNKCGHEYMVTPTNFKGDRRCPYCIANKMCKYNNKTYLFKDKVYDLVGDEYEVLGEYINSKTKILMKHNKCGHEYMVTPNNFLSGKRCRCDSKKSNQNKIKWNDISFREKVKELVGDEYTILSHYINSYTKILIRHNRCGYEYEVLPLSFLGNKKLDYSNGNRCPKCSHKNAKSKYKDIDI